MADKVRVYRMEVMVIDHDRLGPEQARLTLENQRYPNRCMSPKVVALDERTVDWSDDHLLNKRDGWRPAYEALFAGSTVPVSTLAHVMRNALVPSRFQLEKLLDPLDDDTRAARAIRGVATALAFVEQVAQGAADTGTTWTAAEGQKATAPPRETQLAKALVQIVDQIARGSHGPTLAQLLQATHALREAAPRLDEELRGHIQQVDEVVSRSARERIKP